MACGLYYHGAPITAISDAPHAALSGHRLDIDGLRGVAVLAVLAYHAGVPFARGGFSGVDVFFVISGYLLAGLIDRDVRAGRFSYADFYARRILRIVPALAVVTGVILAAGWRLLLPQDLLLLGSTALYNGLMSANIIFWRFEYSYFAHSAVFPLLHTWSLGVEEQFYLVLPAVIALARRKAPAHLTSVLAALIAASFAACVWVTRNDPKAAFYLAPLRAWELLLGALVATSPGLRFSSALASRAAAAAGVAMIVGAAVRLDGRIAFPGPAAILPAAGAALAIAAARQEGLLTWAPLTFVGRVSYSLYLWHWPILVYGPIHLGRPFRPAETALALAASLALAAASWRWVETPFRGLRSRWPARRILVCGAAAAAAALAAGSALRTWRGVPSRIRPDIATLVAARAARTPECTRRTAAQTAAGDLCSFGPESAGRRILVWGDSHAEQMWRALDPRDPTAPVSGLVASLGSCPPVAPGRTTRAHRVGSIVCDDFTEAALALAENAGFSDVVLAAHWSAYAPDTKAFAQELESALVRIEALQARIWIVEQIPTPGVDARYLALRVLEASGPGTPVSFSRQAHESRAEPFSRLLDRLAVSHKFERIDLVRRLCGPELCPAAEDGTLLYADSNHLTEVGISRVRAAFAPLTSPQPRLPRRLESPRGDPPRRSR